MNLHRLSISWVAGRVLPSMVALDDAKPKVSTLTTFASSFDDAGAGSAWTKPWTSDTFSRYWESCFGSNYRATSGAKAWRIHTPLVSSRAPTLASVSDSFTIECRRFAFPAGVGVVISAELTKPIAVADLGISLEDLAIGASIRVDGRPPRNLKATLDELLDGSERELCGRLDASPLPSRTFTISTVSAFDGAAIAPVEGNGDHALLQLLATPERARDAGSAIDLTPLQTALLTSATSFPGTLRYVTKRGRAIVPRLPPTPDGQRRIACYHRNVALATLQTEILLVASAWLAGASALSVNALGLKEVVARTLRLLHQKCPQIATPKPYVYTSEFVLHQISESGLIPEINSLLPGVSIG